MGDFDFVLLKPEDIKEDWQEWYEAEHTKYYTRGGRKIAVEELRFSVQKGLEGGDMFTYGIQEQQNKRVIGTVKIGPIDSVHGLADLAVLIGDKQFLGKGLAPLIISKASELAFKKHQVRKLHSGILERNIPSIKAYTRAGWIVEGVLRNHYVNDGLTQDWLIISRFNPALNSKDIPTGHSVPPESFYPNK
jgi:ribosomal-protein-alanine N-acetyltransferase